VPAIITLERLRILPIYKSMTNHKQFKPGQKVRNNYGQTLTVREQNGCQVFVVEDSFSWYHPTKLHAVEGK
jgi:hypothetical protein